MSFKKDAIAIYNSQFSNLMAHAPQIKVITRAGSGKKEEPTLLSWNF